MSFFGLEIAKRGLFAQQGALHTTGHNIANANTEGYTRQRVNMEATPAFPYPSLVNHTSAGQIGTGVMVGEIQRLRERYLDNQLWTGHKYLGEWEAKFDILSKIETIMNEPSDHGLQNTMDAFWKSWQDLSVNPEDKAARETVRQKGIELTEMFAHLSRSLKDLQDSVDRKIEVTADTINKYAIELRELNRKISDLVPHGYVPNDLYDQRDLLLDKLSKITDIRVEHMKDANGKENGMIKVDLVGVGPGSPPTNFTLVDGRDDVFGPTDPVLEVKKDAGGWNSIVGKRGGSIALSFSEGELGALFELRGVPRTVEDFSSIVKGLKADAILPVAVSKNQTPSDSVLEEGDQLTIKFSRELMHTDEQLKKIQDEVDAKFGAGVFKVETNDYRTFTLTVQAGKTINPAGKTLSFGTDTLVNVEGDTNASNIDFTFSDPSAPSINSVNVISAASNDKKLVSGDKIVITFDQALEPDPGPKDALTNALNIAFPPNGADNFGIVRKDDKTYELKVKDPAAPTDPPLTVNLGNGVNITLNEGDLKDVDGTSNNAITFVLSDSPAVVTSSVPMKGIVDGTIAAYQDRINSLALEMAHYMNLVHTKTASGTGKAYDLDMIAGKSTEPVPFFVSKKDPTKPPENAADIEVNPAIIASINKIAAATDPNKKSTGTSFKGDGSNAAAIAALKFMKVDFLSTSPNSYGSVAESTSFDDFTRSIIAKLGIETAAAKNFQGNSESVIQQVVNQRESISGVSLDEEMSNMIKFQHAYNASARMITAVDEMLDKIINGTGLVGR
jgi:flagellar hook-associated protein FlgK